MILTVEVPAQGAPRCWFAFDEADFIRKARAARPPAENTVFRAGTPREFAATAAAAADARELAARHGWDTPLYRADYLLAPGLYQAEPASEFVAHVAWLAHGLAACRVYLDEGQALDALHADALYAGRDGFRAHMALRGQLIALEVMSDDL